MALTSPSAPTWTEVLATRWWPSRRSATEPATMSTPSTRALLPLSLTDQSIWSVLRAHVPTPRSRPGGARARPAAASRADGAAPPRAAAQALALRGRLRARADALRGRRARGGRAAALVGGGAPGRDAAGADDRAARRPLPGAGLDPRHRAAGPHRAHAGRIGRRGGRVAARRRMDLDPQAGRRAGARAGRGPRAGMADRRAARLRRRLGRLPRAPHALAVVGGGRPGAGGRGGGLEPRGRGARRCAGERADGLGG